MITLGAEPRYVCRKDEQKNTKHRRCDMYIRFRATPLNIFQIINLQTFRCYAPFVFTKQNALVIIGAELRYVCRKTQKKYIKHHRCEIRNEHIRATPLKHFLIINLQTFRCYAPILFMKWWNFHNVQLHLGAEPRYVCRKHEQNMLKHRRCDT